jgi:hypothetical protein
MGSHCVLKFLTKEAKAKFYNKTEAQNLTLKEEIFKA